MKKKIFLLASFAIMAGSSLIYALNRNTSNRSCEGACCKKEACCTEQSCSCTCGPECSGESCDCGCSCCQ